MYDMQYGTIHTLSFCILTSLCIINLINSVSLAIICSKFRYLLIFNSIDGKQGKTLSLDYWRVAF